MPFLIAILIILVSHLTVDRSFPQNVKTTAGVVFAVLGALYVLFGLIL